MPETPHLTGSPEIRAFTTYNTLPVNQLVNDVLVSSGQQSMSGKAQWDTGATNTCISDDAVKALGLTATGSREISTPSGRAVKSTYLVDITLPNNVTVLDVMVCNSEIGTQGIDVLIGMDIIMQGDFAVTCKDGIPWFSFRFPAQERIDFVRDINVEKAIGPRHGKGRKQQKRRKR